MVSREGPTVAGGGATSARDADHGARERFRRSATALAIVEALARAAARHAVADLRERGPPPFTMNADPRGGTVDSLGPPED